MVDDCRDAGKMWPALADAPVARAAFCMANRNAKDVVVSCESSTNLQSWNPVATEPVSSTITNFETEQVTVRVPATTAPFFVRLRATR